MRLWMSAEGTGLVAKIVFTPLGNDGSSNQFARSSISRAENPMVDLRAKVKVLGSESLISVVHCARFDQQVEIQVTDGEVAFKRGL